MTLQQRYRNKRKLKKLLNRWKPIAIIAFMALIIGIAGILVNLPEKKVSGEEIETIESNIIYTIAPLETKITPKEDIIIPKVINDTPQKKTIAREAKKQVSKKSLQPQSDIPRSETLQDSVKKQVQEIANEYDWGNGEQWEALSWIIQKESSWDINAQNKKSTAYSLFQFLDQTWKSYDCVKNNDVENVTRCGIKYIQKRYGSPIEAKLHHIRKGWY